MFPKIHLIIDFFPLSGVVDMQLYPERESQFEPGLAIRAISFLAAIGIVAIFCLIVYAAQGVFDYAGGR